MKKQKTLFDSVEPKKKKKKEKVTKLVEKEGESPSIVEKSDIKKENIAKTKKVVKNDIYVCECGLKINWKIAEARKECPQCNQIIKESDIFDEVVIL